MTHDKDGKRWSDETNRFPRHIAIIMDGNGRWAAQRGLPRIEGHLRGVESVRKTVKAAARLDIPYLTLFSFSSENWSRPKSEVADLMGLLKRFIRRDLADLHKNGIKINVIGARNDIAEEILLLLDEASVLTAGNTRMQLTVAFNYGARDEIARAARCLAEDILEGKITPADITVETLGTRLDTAGLPDPDLLIRTSGEQRLSNFLLWQCAYTELVFIDTYWPDFTGDHLMSAIDEYQGRERRFGGLPARSTA